MNSNDTSYRVRFTTTNNEHQRGFGEFELDSTSPSAAIERANNVLSRLNGSLGRFYIADQEYFIPEVGWGQVFGDKITVEPRMRKLSTDVVHCIAEVGIRSILNPDSEKIVN